MGVLKTLENVEKIWNRQPHSTAKKELALSNKTSVVKGATICDAYDMLVDNNRHVPYTATKMKHFQFAAHLRNFLLLSLFCEMLFSALCLNIGGPQGFILSLFPLLISPG